MGTGSLPGVESGWDVTPTPHPLLVDISFVIVAREKGKVESTILGPTQPPVQWVPAADSLGQKLIAPLSLLLKFRMYGGIPLRPPYDSMTCTGTVLPV
jgi:hypothetical protein